MHARINIVFGNRARVDDGIARLEGADRAVVEATAANRGLTTLVDRAGGVLVAISYWDEPLLSSEAALTEVRESVAAAAGGDLVVERYEVAVTERAERPAPDAVVRMARLQIETARIAEGLDFVRDEVLPRVRELAGFRAAELLIDRESGAGVFLTAWADEHGGIAAEGVLDALRDEAADRVGVKFPSIETFTVVRAA